MAHDGLERLQVTAADRPQDRVVGEPGALRDLPRGQDVSSCAAHDLVTSLDLRLSGKHFGGAPRSDERVVDGPVHGVDHRYGVMPVEDAVGMVLVNPTNLRQRLSTASTGGCPAHLTAPKLLESCLA